MMSILRVLRVFVRGVVRVLASIVSTVVDQSVLASVRTLTLTCDVKHDMCTLSMKQFLKHVSQIGWLIVIKFNDLCSYIKQL